MGDDSLLLDTDTTVELMGNDFEAEISTPQRNTPLQIECSFTSGDKEISSLLNNSLFEKRK